MDGLSSQPNMWEMEAASHPSHFDCLLLILTTKCLQQNRAETIMGQQMPYGSEGK